MELQEQAQPGLAPTDNQPQAQAEPPQQSYRWQASEFIHHDKSTGWYIALMLATIALCIVFAILGQWLSVGVIVIMALAVVVYSRKEPRVLNYQLDGSGVTIESKSLPYAQFSSFSIHPDLSWQSIDLEPAKRFVPRLTLICENDDIAAIEAILASHMPRIERDHDIIERLSRYLKF
jgi:hypothetical protein